MQDTYFAGFLKSYSLTWSAGAYFAGMIITYIILLAGTLASLFALKFLKGVR
jgi:hypothetical protein